MKANVLFLCTSNSARSQIAEGLLRKLAGDQYEALSAGLNPTSLHPLAVEAMGEIGIDISHQRSKSVKEYLGKTPLSAVIFVCEAAEDSCPRLYPPLVPLSWPVENPVSERGSDAERLAKFRQVRDELKSRIEAWLEHRKQLRESREGNPGYSEA